MGSMYCGRHACVPSTTGHDYGQDAQADQKLEMKFADVIDEFVFAGGSTGADENNRAVHRMQRPQRFHEARVFLAPLRGDTNVKRVHAEFIRAVAHVHLVLGEQSGLEFAGGHAILYFEEHEICAGGIDL